MDRIACLLALSRVIETGSFSAAANRLATTQPTISKRIAALEAEFGCAMFQRSSRRLRPTPEALRVYEKASAVIEAYEEARAVARDKEAEVSGTLTISLPTSAGKRIFAPYLLSYLDQNPQVRMDARLTERSIDLIAEGVEMVVRIGDLHDSALRSRPLCRVPRFAVASPGYFSARPIPSLPSDLVGHLCLGFEGFNEQSTWVFEGETGRHAVRIDPEIRLDDAETLLDFVLADAGIGILPGWLVARHLEQGRLEQVLPEFTVPSMPMTILYQANAAPSLRVRSLIDHLLVHRDAISIACAKGSV